MLQRGPFKGKQHKQESISTFPFAQKKKKKKKKKRTPLEKRSDVIKLHTAFVI